MSHPRFCYALTTDGRDEHADMALVSAVFAREAHPEAEIVVACDAESARALAASGHALPGRVDRVLAVETPEGPAGFRNRFVKTTLRQVIEGDFIYFDADTLMMKRIDELWACPAPVAGIANHSGTGSPSEIPADEIGRFELVGWALPTRPYINGGVLLQRDVPEVHRFARLWHEKWKALSQATGRHFDQQALNSALNDSGVDYALLDNRFNAQIINRPSAGAGAHVLHIYASGPLFYTETILHECMGMLRRGDPLAPATVRAFQARSHPWAIRTLADRWVVRRFLERTDVIPPESLGRLWMADSSRRLAQAPRRLFYPALKRRLPGGVARVLDRLARTVRGRSRDSERQALSS